MAEAKVVPYHHVTGKKALDQHILYESFRAFFPHFPIEFERKDPLDPVFRQDFHLGAERCQSLRRHFRAQHLEGVGLERDDTELCPETACLLSGGLYQGFVAPVDPIEIANSDNASA